MALVQHFAALPPGLTWSSWVYEAWRPGISPLVVFDPALGGSVMRPVNDAQLLVFTSGPATGMMIRLIGASDLSITGNFQEANPLPLSGTITGFVLYDRYEDLLIFDDPNDRILTRDNLPWDGVPLLGVAGLTLDAAALQAGTVPAQQLAARLQTTALELLGSPANDLLRAGDSNDVIMPLAGLDTVEGGLGDDRLILDLPLAQITVTQTLGGARIAHAEGTIEVSAVESFVFRDATLTLAQLRALAPAVGTPVSDDLTGNERAEAIDGLAGNDRIDGAGGNDTIDGGAGSDTLIGGDGDDVLFGGASQADLRDLIYGGDGNDSIDGGWGNDELHGGAGNDTITGNFGADTLIGNAGDDVILGAAGSDQISGGPGDDFINGGWGYDRINGGTGADRFFHAGVRDHGSDWIQDYTAADGDVLVFGLAGATRSQFQVNVNFTPSAGQASVAEAFVIYRPTGQILWALVDGAAQSSINLQLGGQVFDLMA